MRFISNWGWGYITGVMMGLPIGIYAVSLLGFVPGTVNMDLFAAGMLLGSSLLATYCRISQKHKSRTIAVSDSPLPVPAESVAPCRNGDAA